MAKETYKNHPSNPAAQGFNIKGKKNLTKHHAWWQLGNNNNRKKGV